MVQVLILEKHQMLHSPMSFKYKLFRLYVSSLLGNLKETLSKPYANNFAASKSCDRQLKAFDKSVRNAPNNIP